MAETRYVVERNTVLLAVLLTAILVAGATYFIISSQIGARVPPVENCTATNETPIISVSGEAMRTVKPDLLVIGLTVETENESMSASAAANAKATAALKEALLANGIKESEIQTSSYYTYPVYNDSCYCPPWPCEGDACPVYAEGGEGERYPAPSRCDCNYEIIGYKTVHSIIIKSENITIGGMVIGGVANVSEARFDYLYFSLNDRTRIEIESELAAEAAEAARKKAERIAEGLGTSLGKIVSIQTEYLYPPYYDYIKASEGSAIGGIEERIPAEIFPQEVTLSSYIYVTYEVKQW